MNREILFRGKRVDNGEWVYGDFVNSHEGWHIIESDYFKPSNGGHPELTEVDPSTVGQFTGLTDKNGVKIFEQMGLRVKHGMGDEDGCLVDAIYRVNRMTHEGVRLSFVRLFSDTPDARSNSYPIYQNLSFNNASLTTDYRNSYYDRIAVNETHGKNTMSRAHWKENHYSNDIVVFEDLTQQS